jgi:hypothetical protein
LKEGKRKMIRFAVIAKDANFNRATQAELLAESDWQFRGAHAPCPAHQHVKVCVDLPPV